MIKDIVNNPLILSRKSEKASKADIQTAIDLLDTVIAHSDHCVGMAANMIGVHKTILVALVNNQYQIMINPKIISKSKESYEAEEGCLSLMGTRKAVRFKSITIEYLDKNFKKCKKVFHDFEAQIIQHEMDHFQGILI